MTYIISDIHGCYEELMALLEKIGFCDEDYLFVLGDAMDRGPEPIRVIQALMEMSNVTYIMGNHDDMMLKSMRALAVDVTEENLAKLTPDVIFSYQHWLGEGGDTTSKAFLALPKEERTDILDFLECAAPYETIEHEGCLYILVHAGIRGFSPDKELDEYDPFDFLWERTDYSRRYFPSERIFLVTGHTPTPMIRNDWKPLIFKENGHIAIDCGCMFGKNLAAYCIETGQATYVASRQG